MYMNEDMYIAEGWPEQIRDSSEAWQPAPLPHPAPLKQTQEIPEGWRPQLFPAPSKQARESSEGLGPEPLQDTKQNIDSSETWRPKSLPRPAATLKQDRE